MIVIPLRTVSGLNVREHWRARARRVKAERDATARLLRPVEKPQLPCAVTLTRVAPSAGLDDDNLPGSLKGCRDQIAAWIGVDDRKREIVRYRYAQRRGAWAVEVEFAPLEE